MLLISNLMAYAVARLKWEVRTDWAVAAIMNILRIERHILSAFALFAAMLYPVDGLL